MASPAGNRWHAASVVWHGVSTCTKVNGHPGESVALTWRPCHCTKEYGRGVTGTVAPGGRIKQKLRLAARLTTPRGCPTQQTGETAVLCHLHEALAVDFHAVRRHAVVPVVHQTRLHVFQYLHAADRKLCQNDHWGKVPATVGHGRILKRLILPLSGPRS